MNIIYPCCEHCGHLELGESPGHEYPCRVKEGCERGMIGKHRKPGKTVKPKVKGPRMCVQCKGTGTILKTKDGKPDVVICKACRGRGET